VSFQDHSVLVPHLPLKKREIPSEPEDCDEIARIAQAFWEGTLECLPKGYTPSEWRSAVTRKPNCSAMMLIYNT